MGSDAPDGFGPPLNFGNNYSVSVSAENEAEARRLFDGLSDGGQVIMPFDKPFWGGLFGMFADKFGVNWMVGCEDTPAAA
jgi:PhnB protein